ncbi:MAG: penicillin acylase family protein [Pseudomonadota bacterium]
MKRVFQVFGLVVLLAIAAAAIWLWTPAPPAFDRDAAFEAAKDYKARIIRDEWGVPHIYGERDSDVAFGLAYAHATDDMMHITESLRFTRGKMGLKTGREGAITDYLMAAVGAMDVAKEKYATDVPEDVQALISGYVAGINFYCAEEKSHCEPGVAPVSETDLIASFAGKTPFFYGLDGYLTELFSGDIDLKENVASAREAYLRLDRQIYPGSNAVAVSPLRTDDGHTRLMVNSHQPFIGPVAWYEARLKSEEGWDMIGSLFPGMPVLSHGATPNLGWAMTVNKPDLIDIYKLTVNDPDNPTQYEMDGEWRDFEMEEVTLRVKLFGPFSFPAKQTVRRSVHGPVFDTPNGFFAVSYSGYQSVKGLEQWYRMNKAANKADWLDAMAIQGFPSFNLVYGDREGNIGYYYNARIPMRTSEWDWNEVAPGNRSDLLWTGFHPFGTAPLVENPQSGYVVNANNTPFDSSGAEDVPQRSDFPAVLGISDRTTNRGHRLQELYGTDDSISSGDFVSYKMDNTYSKSSRIMEFLRDLAANSTLSGNEEFTDALELLSSWDGKTDLNSRAPALAIRSAQLARGIQINDEGEDLLTPEEALRQAIAELEAGFGRIDPEWGEVNRLIRGKISLPLRGGPDQLRAIYSIDNPEDGPLTAIAGDTYILYADWGETGEIDIQTIHQFGSATIDETSTHYDDQAQLFAEERWKRPAMELEELLKTAESDITIGGAK